jgi:hypothetical protein
VHTLSSHLPFDLRIATQSSVVDPPWPPLKFRYVGCSEGVTHTYDCSKLRSFSPIQAEPEGIRFSTNVFSAMSEMTTKWALFPQQKDWLAAVVLADDQVALGERTL